MLRQGLKPIIVVLNNDGYVIEVNFVSLVVSGIVC